MVYGDYDGPRRRKNKAKQSQYVGLWPEIRSTNSEIRKPRCIYRMPVARVGRGTSRMDAIWKNKANMPAFGRKSEVRIPKSETIWKNKPNFSKAKMSAMSIITRGYEKYIELDTWWKQTQSKPIYFVLSTAWCVFRKGTWKNKVNFRRKNAKIMKKTGEKE